jgi:glucokinase
LEEIAMTRAAAIGAVDIGGTKIAIGIVREGGSIATHEEIPTAARDGFDAAMDVIWKTLDRLRTKSGVDLRGIGIGCTGPVDPFTGEIGVVDFLPGWNGRNPVHTLHRMSGLSVAMENDADAAVLGEAAYGAGRDKKNLIFVTIGTGIGGGIVVDGRLYRGVRGAHPEIGHHTIDASGPQCFCGARGCWEVLARGPAIAERLMRESPSDYAQLTAKDVCALARKSDAAALREVGREGRYLGLGIANLITLFTPELIVLGGSVMESADLFMPAIREVVNTQCGLVPAAQVELRTAALGNDAALIGAAVVWLHRFGGI